MKDMIKKIFGVTDFDENAVTTRRRHQRQTGQNSAVVVIIGNDTFPVEDWSQGGCLIDTHGSQAGRFAIGDTFDFVLKFKLPYGTVAIEHKGRVIRTSRHGIAAEFAPMTAAVKRQFGRVMDGLYTGSFSESQAVA